VGFFLSPEAGVRLKLKTNGIVSGYLYLYTANLKTVAYCTNPIKAQEPSIVFTIAALNGKKFFGKVSTAGSFLRGKAYYKIRK